MAGLDPTVLSDDVVALPLQRRLQGGVHAHGCEDVGVDFNPPTYSFSSSMWIHSFSVA